MFALKCFFLKSETPSVRQPPVLMVRSFEALGGCSKGLHDPPIHDMQSEQCQTRLYALAHALTLGTLILQKSLVIR